MKKTWKDFNIVPAWRETKSNECEDNGGTGYITHGLLAFIASDMRKGDYSRSGLAGRAEGKYYYEDAAGKVSESAIDYYEMKHNGIEVIVSIGYENGNEFIFVVK